jgi:hypothetical protein
MIEINQDVKKATLIGVLFFVFESDSDVQFIYKDLSPLLFHIHICDVSIV